MIRKLPRRIDNAAKTADDKRLSHKRYLSQAEPKQEGAAVALDPYVKLSTLAKEANMQPQLVRLWLRGAGLKRPGTRWEWPADSAALTRIREILGLKT